MVVKSEQTAAMPEDYVERNSVEITGMPYGQQREYAEAFEADRMGFSGQEGI